ncbi:MAG: Homoserine O-acetyltransferase [Deltaproteobacteria bacterium]|jgi:homoserine O-acetyltransferase|nr:Homoserine O-acetyltransferase [Deltaproteobacteria bacterium]
MPAELQHFRLGDVELLSGQVLPDAMLAYTTYGELSPDRDNVVLLPTFYTGSHIRNEGFFGSGRAIDPARHFIVSVNLFGNGWSSSPSNADPSVKGPRFPEVSLYDNVKYQRRLLTEKLRVERIRLVAGWSMAGCQAYHWAAQYPEMVDAILPFCASARTSSHNFVFLEGVKAALTADQTWAGGHYTSSPEAGLKAFGRVYAGWAFSQTFYREELYRNLGFDSVEALLQDWEQDHLNWDANDLLAKLRTWQTADISANPAYGGDFERALGSITARAILIPCSTDLYFPPEDNAIEARHLPNAELRTYDSPWGHCVASPGNDPEFTRFLDKALSELL